MTATPTPPKQPTDTSTQQRSADERKRADDQELDKELDETFPASDPLPWSHEVN